MTTVEGLTLLVMAIAAGTPGVIAALGAKRNNDKLNELHVSLDGRLTQFFAAQADALQEIARANQKIGRMDEQRDQAAISVSPLPPPT